MKIGWLFLFGILACGGTDGNDGSNGANGGSCTVKAHPSGALIVCEDGTSQLIKHGEKGEQGIQGIAGQSCMAEQIDNGLRVICGDTEAVVKDGADGKDGINGADGKDGSDGKDGADGKDGVLKRLDPCPTIDTDYKEILLVTSDGVVAYFKNGSYEHLTDVPLGVWMKTTDKRQCRFKIEQVDGEFVVFN